MPLVCVDVMSSMRKSVSITQTSFYIYLAFNQLFFQKEVGNNNKCSDDVSNKVLK